jgi:hypothetical protein
MFDYVEHRSINLLMKAVHTKFAALGLEKTSSVFMVRAKSERREIQLRHEVNDIGRSIDNKCGSPNDNQSDGADRSTDTRQLAKYVQGLLSESMSKSSPYRSIRRYVFRENLVLT